MRREPRPPAFAIGIRLAACARAIAQEIESVGGYLNERGPDVLRRTVCVALEHVGYELRARPGEPLSFHNCARVIEPNRSYAINSQLSGAAWVAL